MERFDRFMERCLYGPDGFYSTSGSAGRRGGDFLTSPEVGPLFGAVVAEMLDEHWQSLGRPDTMTVYDVGCGPGALLKAISVAKPDRPWELIGVDRVASAGATMSELPGDLTGAVVLANELLDNIPFRIVECSRDGFDEVHVVDGAEQLEPAPAELDAELTAKLTLLDVAVGVRFPVLDQAAQWVESVLARNPSLLVLVDYGAPTTAELAERGGWLRTYRQHQRGSDPLTGPGECDITTDVAWDQLPAADSLETQRDFLQRLGIDRLVEEGREYWKANAAAPDLTAIRMRSRVSEVEALVDPDGLGGWWVAAWGTK